jgi:prophage antirepressor-like protein
MRTDEEWMIAKTVCRILGIPAEKEDIREKEKD